MEAVKKKATEANMLSEDDLKHCFVQQKIQMERSMDSGREYIEGDKVKDVKK